MGVLIKSSAVVVDADSPSIIEHSARAARACLAAAGVEPEQVGVLINAGVHRDSNMVEPAMSALIQQAAGIGLEYGDDDPRTFSFDLMNGATGILDAVQVGTSILQTGSAEYVLVVSGDTHPSLTRTAADDDFPYATAGAALLLEKTGTPGGFARVHTESDGGTAAVEAYVDTATMGTSGRSVMVVERETGFDARLLEVALRAARNALREGDAEGFPVDPATIALATSRPVADFPDRIAAELQIDADAVLSVPQVDGDPHTAALTLAYDAAVGSGALAGRTHVLFVAAGAGPSAAATIYRIPDSVRRAHG